MNDDDFWQAEEEERQGDATGEREVAEAHYRHAQRILLPTGARWTDRAAYDLRQEALDRIQQKIYDLPSRAPAAPPETPVPAPQAPFAIEPPSAPSRELSVGEFFPGLIVRVLQDFRDYDGQEIHAGEVLHYFDGSYFPYESGYTLMFAEKTVRLAGIVEEHEPIIANAANAWFLPITA